jgi:hypothetical protein
VVGGVYSEQGQLVGGEVADVGESIETESCQERKLIGQN